MNIYIKFSLFLTIFLVLLLIFLNETNIQKEERQIDEEKLPAIRVNLVNGCGIDGIAKEMSSEIQKKNIDVIECKNADNFIYNKSMIVIVKNDSLKIERIKNMLNIDLVTYALNEDSDVTFEIIIGNDFKYFIKENHE